MKNYTKTEVKFGIRNGQLIIQFFILLFISELQPLQRYCNFIDRELFEHPPPFFYCDDCVTTNFY